MRWETFTTLICVCTWWQGCSKPEPHPLEPAAAAEPPDSENPGPPEEPPAPAVEASDSKSDAPSPQEGNPAFKKCVDAEGEIQMVTESGAALDVCVFGDGSRCEVFALADGACAPGSCNHENGLCKE